MHHFAFSRVRVGLCEQIPTRVGEVAGQDLPASVRPTECNRAHDAVLSGCNEPGPFSEGYLDKGTQGSLLMAFSRRENKGSHRHARANRNAHRAEAGHT